MFSAVKSGIKIFFLTAFFLLLPSISWADHGEFAGYTIRNIFIIRHNVFDLSKPEESGAVAEWGNRIHVITQENVIRQELLFKEGDIFDQHKLEETERNLRAYSFLTKVRIKVDPRHGTREVDITVSTQDQWSLIVGATFGGTSDNSEAGLDIGEKNLVGTGQTVNYRMRHSNAGFTNSFGYEDTTFFDTRYALSIDLKKLPDELQLQSNLEKPFYSLNTKSAHGINYTRKNHHEETLNYDSIRVNAYYGRAYDFWDDDLVRMKAQLSVGEQVVNRGELPQKVNRDNKAIASVEFLFNPHDYEKARYLEKFRQMEDIPTGLVLRFSLGPRARILGSTTSDVSTEFYLTKNFKFFANDFMFNTLNVSRKDDNFNDFLFDYNLVYYLRRLIYQTFVFNLRFSVSESEVNRFNLGGAFGLRGFKTDEFSGQNRLILNIEDRIFTYKSMLYGIIEPGFVLFADIGNAWNDGPGDEFKSLHRSVGAGLRIALVKAPGISLIRVDYGQSLDFRRSPVLTIGMEGFF